jgi:outer membrane biosynthesis protein TonB
MTNVKRVFYYLWSTNDGSEISMEDSQKIFKEIVKGIVSLHPKPKEPTPPPPKVPTPLPPKVPTPPPPKVPTPPPPKVPTPPPKVPTPPPKVPTPPPPPKPKACVTLYTECNF